MLNEKIIETEDKRASKEMIKEFVATRDTLKHYLNELQKKKRSINGKERNNLPTINQSITMSRGKSVNYTNEGNNSIRITSIDALNRDVMVVYRSFDTDEDGLPFLNDKEVAAVAAGVAKREMVKKAFMGVALKDKTSVALLQYITAESARLLTAAKIDENITDDAIDKMLDVKTSWDRKQYGRRFHLIN